VIHERTTADGTSIVVTPEAVSRTREGDPKKLSSRLHGDLDAIVMMALRKEPQRRYSSVYEFSEDIRRHLEGLPVQSPAEHDLLSWNEVPTPAQRRSGGSCGAPGSSQCSGDWRDCCTRGRRTG
jgi:hypothetical protein